MTIGTTGVRLAWVCVAALSAAVTAGAASAQEAFRLRHTPEAGHAHEYEVELSLRLEQRIGEEEATTTEVRQKARLRLRAVEVDAQGAGRIGVEVAQLTQRISDDEGPMLFEWPKVTTEITPDTERYKAFAQVCGAIAGATLTLTVDADGRVTGVEGLERVVGAMGEQTVFDQSIVGAFSARQLASTLQPIFNSDRQEGGAPLRRVGDGWQNIERVALGDVGAFQIVTEMRVGSMEEGVATVIGTPTFELLRPTDADATTARVRIASQSGAVVVRWDTQRGVLVRRTASQDIGTVWTLGGLELTQSQRAETTVTRVE